MSTETITITLFPGSEPVAYQLGYATGLTGRFPDREAATYILMEKLGAATHDQVDYFMRGCQEARAEKAWNDQLLFKEPQETKASLRDYQKVRKALIAGGIRVKGIVGAQDREIILEGGLVIKLSQTV